MLRLTELPLRFIRLDGHNLGIFWNVLGVISYCSVMFLWVLRNKNSLRIIGARPKFGSSYNTKKRVFDIKPLNNLTIRQLFYLF